MKKTLSIITLVVFVVAICASIGLANAKINKNHASLKSKDGKAVNCVYCHGPVKKNKDQKMLKGQDKFKDIAKIASCADAKCHK